MSGGVTRLLKAEVSLKGQEVNPLEKQQKEGGRGWPCTPTPIAGLGSPRKSGVTSGDIGVWRPPWASSGQALGSRAREDTVPDGVL